MIRITGQTTTESIDVELIDNDASRWFLEQLPRKGSFTITSYGIVTNMPRYPMINEAKDTSELGDIMLFSYNNYLSFMVNNSNRVGIKIGSFHYYGEKGNSPEGSLENLIYNNMKGIEITKI